MALVKSLITGTLVKFADHVLTVDERLAQKVKQYRPKSLDYLRNMPMADMFDGVGGHNNPQTIDFAYIGSLAPERGLEEFLQAWHNIEPQIRSDRCNLHIYGEPCGDASYYESKIRPFVNNETVFYYGKMSFEDIPWVYKSMDCIVVPGQGDNLQLKLGEAMVAGVPVILRHGPYHVAVTKGIGVSWIHSSCVSSDVDAMELALKGAIAVMPVLKADARMRAENLPFSWENDIERLVEKYKEIIR
jgi:glycosyltransferase involved in cell wall biosynthesis